MPKISKEYKGFSIEILLAAILSLLLYSSLSFGLIQRTNTYLLFGTFVSLGLLLLWLMSKKPNLRLIIVLGILFRIIFIPYLPSLSQDFYRYIWDGVLQLNNLNPYLFSPTEVLSKVDFPLAQQMHEAMGKLHARNFSNYPPLSQWIYFLSANFHNGDLIYPVIVLRIFAFIGEILVFIYGFKILALLGKSPLLIGWFFLNPLVIIESFGNLHFEALMIGLCLGGFYFAFRNKPLLAGLFFGLSISTKLLPLLLVPVFLKLFPFKFLIRFLSCCGFFALITWVPFLNLDLISNYSQTIKLWFINFEFNGSLYYLAREVHYLFYDFNILRRIGRYTPYLVVSIVLFCSFLLKNKTKESVFKSSLLILTLYFFTTTTVHPWYIISVLALGIPLGYFYTVVWSLVVMWSYWAYGGERYNENLWIILLEYLPVYFFFVLEMTYQPLLKNFCFTRIFYPRKPDQIRETTSIG